MNERIFESRPEEWLDGFTGVATTPSGERAYVTLNFHEGLPVEVFIVLGKAGTDERAAAEGLARLCSVALQHGVPLRVLTKQLRGISSEITMGFGPGRILSMPDAVGRILESLDPTSNTHAVPEAAD